MEHSLSLAKSKLGFYAQSMAGSYWKRSSAFQLVEVKSQTEVTACEKMPNLLITRQLRASKFAYGTAAYCRCDVGITFDY